MAYILKVRPELVGYLVRNHLDVPEVSWTLILGCACRCWHHRRLLGEHSLLELVAIALAALHAVNGRQRECIAHR